MPKRSLLLAGVYTPGTSFLYRLDPRVKLTISLCIIAISLFSYSILFHGGLALAVLFLLLSVGIPAKSFVKFIIPLLIAVTLTFCLHLIFTGKDGRELTSILGLKITFEGVMAGILFSLRVVLFFFATVIVTATVAPSDMADSITQTLRPLGKIGIPAQDLSLILFMAMRFIPLLYDEFTSIMYAQEVRGVSFSGSLFSRARNMTSVMIPAFAGITQRADSAAIALKARGFSTTIRRTQYMERTMRVVDWVVLLTALSAIALFFYLTIPHEA